MADTVTVTFEDALRAIKENLEVGRDYKQKDIREVLENKFPNINPNQISGLMTRFINKSLFDVKREIGHRNTYVFTGGKKMACLGNDGITVKDYVKHTLQTSIASLKTISFGDIKSTEDFKLLKNTEEKLQEMLKEL
ncbi:hypothetical protein CN964_21255 [Bacillus cereus]|uniref:hypothetical protein n=1 Tax=Bacillus cereus TaxID=1396 RepID=UPI000BF8CBF6|nr:hypothetical protein [Bacillus cereus]MEC0073217.1 hypothetical protein [Bacillus cereus]PFJ30939.1 hypothetical protein COI90_20710 [Bacillus cereus]PFO23927.1 hypothetical protein COJ80_16615 [Bacillus cereus]PGN71170.1 hypothetical protein CN964_21255 [Bacillus cereus]PGT98613.1 hypothetical protein COD20_24245 [Bacillus cereus]